MVFNESHNLSLEFFDRRKVATFDHIAKQDAEPNLDLIHPGDTLGCVVKDDAMSRVGHIQIVEGLYH
jgi:hypothetical protein